MTANFALWDTILDVKYFILPALQPIIINIQQIRFIIYNDQQQSEASDHILLRHFLDKYFIKILINIEHHENIEYTKNILNTTAVTCVNHPEYGNILDTNITIPKPILGYINKKTGKLYKNIKLQTLYYEKSNIKNQNNENTNSFAIQTIQTRDATSEVTVEFGTQTETMSVLQSLNIIKQMSNYKNTIK